MSFVVSDHLGLVFFIKNSYVLVDNFYMGFDANIFIVV